MIMFVSIATIAALSALSSTVVTATPTRRATTFCDQLVVSCAATGPQAITDPWNIPACIYGATCFGGSRPVDAFLLAIATERNVPELAKASLDTPYLTVETFNTISTDNTVITQHNFIDGVYSTLSATNGPYPDVSFVISSFQRISIWTQLCNSVGIPWSNFADYFKYSATVNSPECPPVFSTIQSTSITASSVTFILLPTTSFTASSMTFISLPSSTITATSVTFIPLPSISGPTTVRFTTSLPISSPPTYPVVSAEPSCQKMFETCVVTVDFYLTDPWSSNACLFAASCIPGNRSADSLLSTVYTLRTGNGASTAPKSLNLPRFSDTQFRKISSNGRTITPQNWIDAYYGLLSTTGGPWPSSADLVLGYFRRIQTWTAFCGSDGIPYKNVADYFQYSSTVLGPSTC